MGKSRKKKRAPGPPAQKRAEAPPAAPAPAGLSRPIVAMIFGVALLARFLFLATLQDSPFFTTPIIDAHWHHTWAQEIAAGNWQGEGAFFRAPLYPFVVGLLYRLFGDGPFAPRVLQHLLGACSAVFVTYLAHRLTGRRRAAYLAGGIAALYGTFFYFEGELLIVTLIVFLDLGALAWLARLGPREAAWRYLGPGVLLGLSAIARPTVLIFWPVLLAWLWLRGDRARVAGLLRRAAAVSLAFLAPALVVTAYNYAESGDLVVVASQGGVNFFIGNNPASDGKTAVAPGRQREIGEYRDNVWVASKSIAEEELGRELAASEVSRHWFRKGLGFWSGSPGRAAGLFLRKVYYLFHGYEIPNNMDPYFSHEWSWVLRLLMWDTVLFLPFGLIGPLGLIGVFFWCRRLADRPEQSGNVFSLLLLFGGSYAASVVLFFVNARFRLPVIPVFIVFAALAVDHLIRVIPAGPGRHLRDLAALGVLVVALNLPVLGVTRKMDPAWDYVTTGVSYHLGGRSAQALAWYERALEIVPGHPRVLGNMGTLYLELNRLDEAADALLETVKSDPAQIEAVVNLSSLLLQQNRPEEALQVCERALAIDPDLHAAAFNKGRALVRLQRGAEADRAFLQAIRGQPDNFRYVHELAMARMEDDRCPEAIGPFRQALALRPEEAGTHLGLGACLAHAGEEAQALEEFQRAWELDPGMAESALNLGILHEKAQRFDEAVRWYERALEVEEQLVALVNLGQIRGRVYNDYRGSIELLERAARIAPDNAVVFFNLGSAYHFAGDQARSRAAFQQAVQLDPRLRSRIGGGG